MLTYGIECDRCGTITERKEGVDRPAGWVLVRVEFSPQVTVGRDLCPDCYSGLVDYLAGDNG